MELTIAPTLVSMGLRILFFVLLFAFALQAFFLAYHWFHYGTSKRLSTIALCIYLCGGSILLIIYASALGTI
jgi:hypothetical protein